MQPILPADHTLDDGIQVKLLEEAMQPEGGQPPLEWQSTPGSLQHELLELPDRARFYNDFENNCCND